MAGRHSAESYGYAATGAQISTSAVNVFSVRGGLIRELRVVFDPSDLVEQLSEATKAAASGSSG